MAAPTPPGRLQPSIDADVARAVASVKHGHREIFEERAGILEFESGLPRAEAKSEALVQTREFFGLTG